MFRDHQVSLDSRVGKKTLWIHHGQTRYICAVFTATFRQNFEPEFDPKLGQNWPKPDPKTDPTLTLLLTYASPKTGPKLGQNCPKPDQKNRSNPDLTQYVHEMGTISDALFWIDLNGSVFLLIVSRLFLIIGEQLLFETPVGYQTSFWLFRSRLSDKIFHKDSYRFRVWYTLKYFLNVPNN